MKDRPGLLYRATSQDGRVVDITQSDLELLDLKVLEPGSYNIVKDNRVFNVDIVQVDRASQTFHIIVNGKDVHLTLRNRVQALADDMGFGSSDSELTSDIHAPMPGTVLEVKVSEGDRVDQGSPLVILEAMKMENVITAIGEGIVSEICVEVGQAVAKGQLLLRFQ